MDSMVDLVTVIPIRKKPTSHTETFTSVVASEFKENL
jgi:hypothetical protein